MHVLVLEERINSLEEEVKGLRSKLPVNQVTAHWEARGKRKMESYAKALNTISHPVLLQVIRLVV